MIKKNYFIAVEPLKGKDGKWFTDDDGAVYFAPHSHPLLAGKEFANQIELVQLIADHNRPKPDVNDPSVMVSQPKPFHGEVILFNVLTF